MPADVLLVNLLQALQHSNQHDQAILLSTSTSLLITLSNPRNLSVLTTQLLLALDLTTLQACLALLRTYQSAASTLLKHEDDVFEDSSQRKSTPGRQNVESNLSRDEWVHAVFSGIDKRSATWKHTLVVGGLLLGFQRRYLQGVQGQLRRMVESALVASVNEALDDVSHGGQEGGGHAVALALTYCFDFLDDARKADLNYDRLLPALLGSAFFSIEGYRSGYFFAGVDADLVQASDGTLSWSPLSTSFGQISDASSKPLVVAMGPLSRLIAHSAEQVENPFSIQPMMDDLVEFSKTILSQWRSNKLSIIDAHDEVKHLSQTTMSSTLPALWKLLRSTLFAVSIVLRAVAGRVLGDRVLAGTRSLLLHVPRPIVLTSLIDYPVAPLLAVQMLDILRNLFFISSRLGSNMLTHHTFVYLTAIDILSAYPSRVEVYIREIRPLSLGHIPPHPLDRSMDLFFLNTAEHFTFILSPEVNQNLLVAATTPYLVTGENRNFLEIFEAAHSVTLAVFSAPKNALITASYIPFYVDALFKVFPQSLSPLQFRLAFKTLIRITTPSSPLASMHPDLPEILLDLVHRRILDPPIVRPTPCSASPIIAKLENVHVSSNPVATGNSQSPYTEIDMRTALMLTIIDSLPCLPLSMLDEWLPQTADLIAKLDSESARQQCRQRFWEAISDGEMDIERSQVCIAWWSTMGGKERVCKCSTPRDLS